MTSPTISGTEPWKDREDTHTAFPVELAAGVPETTCNEIPGAKQFDENTAIHGDPVIPRRGGHRISGETKQ